MSDAMEQRLLAKLGGGGTATAPPPRSGDVKKPAKRAQSNADGRAGAPGGSGAGDAEETPESASEAPATEPGDAAEAGSRSAGGTAVVATSPAADALALIAVGADASPFQAAPEPEYVPAPPDEIPAPVLRMALMQGQMYAAARRKAAERWRDWARVIAGMRAAGYSEEALAAMAAQTGAPLPPPEQ